MNVKLTLTQETTENELTAAPEAPEQSLFPS
jgi:hypothetical protein